MPTQVTRTIHINAPPDAVWAVMIDVERWAEWTDSVRKITREGSGKFGAGFFSTSGDYFDWQVRIGYHPGVRTYVPPPPAAPPPPPPPAPANRPPTHCARVSVSL